jgi:hypothetical protein
MNRLAGVLLLLALWCGVASAAAPAPVFTFTVKRNMATAGATQIVTSTTGKVRAYAFGADSTVQKKDCIYIGGPTYVWAFAPDSSYTYSFYLTCGADTLIANMEKVFVPAATIGKINLGDACVTPDNIYATNAEDALYVPLSDGSGSFVWTPMAVAVTDTMILSGVRYYAGEYTKQIDGVSTGNAVVWSSTNPEMAGCVSTVSTRGDTLVIGVTSTDCIDMIISYTIGVSASAASVTDSVDVADKTLALQDVNIGGTQIAGYVPKATGTYGAAWAKPDSALIANGTLSPHDLSTTGWTGDGSDVMLGSGTIGTHWGMIDSLHTEPAGVARSNLAIGGTATEGYVPKSTGDGWAWGADLGTVVTFGYTTTSDVHNGRKAVYVAGMTSSCMVVANGQGTSTGTPPTYAIVNSTCKTDSLVFWACDLSGTGTTYVVKYAYKCP